MFFKNMSFLQKTSGIADYKEGEEEESIFFSLDSRMSV